MAVVKTPQETRLGIKVENGVSGAGAPVFKTLRFSNVKPSATDQEVLDTGVTFAALQGKALAAIIRTDDATLASE
jgi:hypothetical protein